MIRYLTGATGSYFEESGVAHERGVGLLVQPGNHYHLRVQHYPGWAADNGAFSRKGFNPERFRAMLAQPNLHANRATCLFVAAPDVLVVNADGSVFGDAAATLKQFPAWAAEIRALGFPVALVAQNGLEDMLGAVPWHLVDVLFLGGGPDARFKTKQNPRGEWKLGAGAQKCVAAARARGKRTHMGRVNSYKRLALAQSWHVDTADGTFMAYGPAKNLPRLLAWLDKLTAANDNAIKSAAANDNGIKGKAVAVARKSAVRTEVVISGVQRGGVRPGAGRKPVEGSARNGGVRVVCIVTPDVAERADDVCAELGVTRGELLTELLSTYVPSQKGME